MTEALRSVLFPRLLSYYDFIRLPVGLRDEPFLSDLPRSCLEQVLLRLAFLIKFFQQDLPSSLSKPISESCRLHNGRHAAGKQVSAALDSHLLCIKCFCLTTFVISLLHQRFIFIHLSDTYLLFFSKSFSLTVHHLCLSTLAA